jgi:nitrite reductase (cytochrome c-552)
MKKYKVLTLALGVLLGIGLIGCSQTTTPTSTNITISEDDLDPAIWGKVYPNQYDSYLKNNEMVATKYGGSVPKDKLKDYPFLKTIFAGYGFSKEYNEDRGHTYALEDVKKIKRVNDKTTGSCLACKSPSYAKKVKAMGVAYYKVPFSQLAPTMHQSIACIDCHDPKTMELRVERPTLIDALKRQGKDIKKATRQEMRTYVCAQCHVEYYFKKDTKEVTFPWDKGMDPASIEKYYDTLGFSDWEYPGSGTKMLKAQHPDYEMFSSSTHAKAGLACADCHMPYQRVGKEKISSHQWTSPLQNLNNACGQCHREGNEWLKERVYYTQDKTYELLNNGGKALEEAIKAIDTAVKDPKANKALVEEAKKLHRSAQWNLDFVAAESSMGFHNPQLAISTLGKAVDLARQAQLKASIAIK